MNTDNANNEIAIALAKHSSLCDKVELDESEIPRKQVPSSFLGDDYQRKMYCGIWENYDYALLESIDLIAEYEKSLIAWHETIDSMSDDSAKLVVAKRYIYPTLRLIWDLPTTYKDQMVRAVVKLHSVSAKNYSIFSQDRHWIAELKRIACSDFLVDIFNQNILEKELYSSNSASRYRRLHATAFHDVSPTLLTEQRYMHVTEDWVMFPDYLEQIDLSLEIESIDEYRKTINKTYPAFYAFASVLYGTIVDPEATNRMIEQWIASKGWSPRQCS